ncbi:MAG: PEGA domain-containing protein [Polyangiaceae bacterium]|nr:PEGA domain-containing protein [Polyangiaceae bacterium]
MRRFWVWLCFGLALSAGSSTRVWADDPSAPNAADALFREGRRAADAGDLPTACDKFSKSLALERTAGTLFNLALCEQQLNRLVGASKHFEEAASRMKDGDPRKAAARERVAAIDPLLPYLTFKLKTPNLIGMEVTLDGEIIPMSNLTIPRPVDPGKHVVRVTATGYEARETVTLLQTSQTLEVELEPGLPAPAATPPSNSSPKDLTLPEKPRAAMSIPTSIRASPPSPKIQVAGFSLMGIGAAGLIFGGIGAGMVAREQDIYDANCPNNACRDQSGLDAANRGTTWSITATTSLVAGGVVAAVGLGLFLYYWSKTSDTPPSSTHRALQIRVDPSGIIHF